MSIKSFLHKKMITPLIFVLLFTLSFVVEDLGSLWTGYLAILRSPSQLITDYLYVGGLGATLFNVSTILLMNMLMLYHLKIKMSGPVFAGLLTIAGFSFFGKNLFNTLPIYLGIYLYARRQRLEFRSFIIVALFSTGISPLVSFLIFGNGWPLYIGLPLGIVAGIITGYILPALSAHTTRFHKGYNLYNIGFALGILSMFYSAILTAFGIEYFIDGMISNDYHETLIILTLVLSLIFIVSAFIMDKNVLKSYPNLMKSTGRLVSDFIRDYGRAPSLLNVGIMGIISLLALLILSIQINGPVMGGILTVMGFGAFGKHPRNSIPVMAGALLGASVTPVYSIDQVSMAIAVLFVTALAPIAGRYGFFIGVLAGFLHIIITPLAFRFQGGFDLYNNGFAAGFVAALVVPFLEAIFKDNKREGDES